MRTDHSGETGRGARMKHVEPRAAETAADAAAEAAAEAADAVADEAAAQTAGRVPDDLFELAPRGIAVYDVVGDAEDFIFAAYNRAAERLDGVGREAVLGRSVREVFPDVDRFGLTGVFERVWRTGRSERLRMARYDDGRLDSWRDNHVARAASGQLVAFYDEVSEQRRVVERLREASDIIDRSPAVAFAWRLEEGWPVAYASAGVESLLGLRAEDLVTGQVPYADVVHPDDLPRVRQEVAAANADPLQHRLVHQPYRLVRPDGTARWVEDRTFYDRDDRGQIVHARGIVLDITERCQAEEERQRLITAIEQTAEIVVIADTRGAVRFLNPAFETMTGRPAGHLIGRSYARLLGSGTGERTLRAMLRAVAAGEIWHGRLRCRRADRTAIEVDATVSPVRDRRGRTIDYVAVLRDVSELSELETRLRQAQKMEAIGTLAGGIAHDFNNLLYAILGYTELALDAAAGDETLRETLEQVHVAGCRARELVSQILTFSRQRERRCEPLDLAAVIRDALKLMRSSLPSTIEMRHHIEDGGERVLGDPTGVHQVVMNLCTNAYQAMRDTGGLLEIELGVVDLSSADAARQLELGTGRYARLSVRDTGCGMDASTQQRIFDPFFTTKVVGEGTGMGLAIVHGIVSSMGGAIRVESRPGAGSRFDVLLPVFAADATATVETDEVDTAVMADRAVAPGAEESPAADHARVLVVEDEPALCKLLRTMLESLGHRAEECRGASEALSAFRADPAGYDVVITDQTMPGMSGAELCRELLAIRPDVPVLLCTGYGEGISAEGAGAVGAQGYLAKPIDRITLDRAVRRVL